MNYLSILMCSSYTIEEISSQIKGRNSVGCVHTYRISFTGLSQVEYNNLISQENRGQNFAYYCIHFDLG